VCEEEGSKTREGLRADNSTHIMAGSEKNQASMFKGMMRQGAQKEGSHQ